jgi:hypothetical protein
MIKVMIVLMIGVTAVFGIVIVMTHRGGMWRVMTSASSRTVRKQEKRARVIPPTGQASTFTATSILAAHDSFLPTPYPRPHANSPPTGDSF